jgi:transposase
VEAKKALEIPLHERPSSPDLNPIENVWRISKQLIKQRSRFPSILSKMKQAVQKEWDRLQPSNFNGMQTQY